MRRLASIPALLALAALLVACSLPPYNEQLSLAQVTRSKLGTPANKIGPVYAWLDDNSRQNQYYFLPERDDPVDSGGFLVSTTSYGVQIWYLADYSTGLESWISIGIENASERANNYLLQPLKSASATYDICLVRYTQSDAYFGSNIHLIQATTTQNISEIYVQNMTDLLSSIAYGTCAGSNIFPLDSALAYDMQYFLGYTSTGTYFEVESNTDAASLKAVANLASLNPTLEFALSPPLPTGIQNAFYQHANNSGRSYLSYWNGVRYRTFSWYSASAPSDVTELGGIEGPVNAVLTSGQLLSFADNSCTVYGPAGWKQYKFPMGALKFCYESIDAGVPTLYFSLAYWQYGKDEDADELYVEVYAIPTANLKNLN